MEELCPGRAWVERPLRRSKSRTDFSDVPTATSSVEEGCDENECVYGVESRMNVCTGVITAGCNADSLSVPSYDVENIVDGVGSKG